MQVKRNYQGKKSHLFSNALTNASSLEFNAKLAMYLTRHKNKMNSYQKIGLFPKHCTHFLGRGLALVMTLMLQKNDEGFNS